MEEATGFLAYLTNPWVAWILATVLCAIVGVSFSTVVRKFLPDHHPVDEEGHEIETPDTWPMRKLRWRLYLSALVASFVFGLIGTLASLVIPEVHEILSAWPFVFAGVFGAIGGLLFREGVVKLTKRIGRRIDKGLDRIAPTESTLPPVRRDRK